MRFVHHAFALLFLVLIVASCRSSPEMDAEWKRQMAEYQAFQDVCRRAPYAAPTPEFPLPEGVRYIPCGDGHQFVIAWDGAREKGLAGPMRFAEKRMAALYEKYGLQSMGMGLCCDSDQAPAETRSYWCGRVELVACSTTLSDFAKTVAELHAADGPDAVPLGLSIRIDGVRNKGPRCTPDDPKCGPSKPHWAPPFDAKRPRNTLPHTGRGTCSHDGDCNPVGCEHEGCWSWQSGIRFGTCFDPDPRDKRIPVYCGCVEGSCSLFQ